MKAVLKDRNGKQSMKRMAGAFGFINGVLMAWAMIILKANFTVVVSAQPFEIDSTLIIGILTASAGLLVSTIGEKKDNQEELN